MPVSLTNRQSGEVTEFLALLDTGCEVDIISQALAEHCAVDIVSRSGTLGSFRPQDARQHRRCTRRCLELGYGDSRILISPDVVDKLQSTPYMILGRRTMARLLITVGPIEYRYPSEVVLVDDDGPDVTERIERLRDDPIADPVVAAERDALRADAAGWLEYHTSKGKLDSFIQVQEAELHIDLEAHARPVYRPQFPPS